MHRLVASAAAVLAAVSALALAPSARADSATAAATAAATANVRTLITARTARQAVRAALTAQKLGFQGLTHHTKIDFFSKPGSNEVTFVAHSAGDLDRAARAAGRTTFLNYPIVGKIVLDKSAPQRGAARVSDAKWLYGFDTKGLQKVDFKK